MLLCNQRQQLLDHLFYLNIFEQKSFSVSHLGLSHRLSIVIAYVIFLFALISTVMVLVPIVGRQLSLLLAEFPTILGKLQTLMIALPEQYSDYITAEQFQILVIFFKKKLRKVIMNYYVKSGASSLKID